MSAVLSQYLDIIRNNLSQELNDGGVALDELQCHIEDELEEMREAGMSEDEAADRCISLLGSARMVARQIYEAHSQGSWKQALLASMPHMVFGLMFTLNWYQGIHWLVIMLGVILGIAFYGWMHGRPLWLFPWLGCSLLPVMVAGICLLYLPRALAWVTILVYVPLALALVYFITIQTIKRDWLYSSLMMLPVPTIIGWFLAVDGESAMLDFDIEYLQYFAPSIGLSFLALALSVAAFIRLRQRWLRIALLFLSGFLTLLMVAFYTEGRLGLASFIVLVLLMVGLLLVPALVDRRMRRNVRT